MNEKKKKSVGGRKSISQIKNINRKELNKKNKVIKRKSLQPQKSGLIKAIKNNNNFNNLGVKSSTINVMNKKKTKETK